VWLVKQSSGTFKFHTLGLFPLFFAFLFINFQIDAHWEKDSKSWISTFIFQIDDQSALTRLDLQPHQPCHSLNVGTYNGVVI
jgi:hypothetical protein